MIIEMNLQDYKGVFVFVQQVDGKITNVSYELIGKAKELAADLSTEVTAVLLGYQVGDLCKLLAGVDEEGAAKRVFVTGIFAVVFSLTYSMSNLSLLLLGRTYSGEIPPSVQLASLVVSLFLLVFLVTFRKYSLRRTPKGGTESNAARHGAQRFKAE